MQTITYDDAARAYYVYGVVAGPAVALPDVHGIDQRVPLSAIAEGGLMALVSPVDPADFAPDLIEERLADLTWLEPRARAHQEVLSRVAAAVAPLRFGTIFLDADGVRAMLRENGPLFRAALARLEGRREWGVKIVVNPRRLTDHLIETSPQVRSLIVQRDRMASGATYLFQKKIDMLLLDLARRQVEACVAASHARLSILSAAVAGGAAAQRQDDGNELIFKGAYLVAEDQLAVFMAEVESLDAQFVGFSFALTGPWPAYSFAVAPVEDAAYV